MIRPLRVLAFCLAAAGCQTDIPEEKYDLDHPLDQVLVTVEPTVPLAVRARANLQTRIGASVSRDEAQARLRSFGIDCRSTGSGLECNYARYYVVNAKGLPTRWRAEFNATVVVGNARVRVTRLCLTWSIPKGVVDAGMVAPRTECDPAQPQ